MPLAIRAERPGDEAAIAALVQRAYADVPHSDHREHLMIARLRETAAFLPALSLLATTEGEPVGHLLLTRARIVGDPASVETLALAPLSVVPGHQRQGIGGGLLERAHLEAARLGFGSIMLVGLPGYYPRFGYEPMRRHGITLPFSAPEENQMVRVLRDGALDGVAGEIEYAPGWLEH